MLTFTLAAFFLIITPGPGVLSTAGVGASFGQQPGTRYIFGLFLGNAFAGVAVVMGLAALILADPRIRTILFLISFSYLGYLAFRIAFSKSRIAFIQKAKPPGVIGGLVLQIFNPKAYAVNTAFFTGFVIWPDGYLAEVAVKFLIINAIWIPVHFGWLWAGVALGRLDLSTGTQSAINIVMATLMMAVVVMAALTAI